MSVRMFRKGLEELGHEIFVFAPDWKGYEDKETNIIRYPSLMYRYKIEYPLAFSYSLKINRIVKDLKLDLIHSQQPFSIAKDGLRQAKRNKIPVIFTHHARYDQYIHYIPLLPQKYLKWHVNRRATKFANSCDAVVAPSSEIKKIIQANGVEKEISVIPTGIETDRFRNGKREEIRKKLGFNKSDVVLMNLGRIEEEKNISFLIDSVVQLMKKHQQAKLLMVGEGSLRKPIREKMKKEGLTSRAVLPGLVKQENVQDYYSAGDIFVHSSLSETQGITTNEAMTVGLAVVAVRATGPIDAIDDGRTGILTDNDIDEFTERIEELILDENKRRMLSENARNESVKWDYKNRAREMGSLYKKVIENHNRGE